MEDREGHGLRPDGICTDCGQSTSLLWLSPSEVRRHSLGFIDRLDKRVPEGFVRYGRLYLTTDGWQYDPADSEEEEAAELLRVHLGVTRRTMWFYQLAYALILYAKHWLCHGGVTKSGQRVPSFSCYSLDPVVLNRQWFTLYRGTNGNKYRSVNPAEMRDLFNYLDDVQLRPGSWQTSVSDE